MVTGRLPMGTSFTILLSNMRLSFGISMSSPVTIATWNLSRPAAQPREPPLGILVRPHNNNRDVVGATALVGQRDQFLRRPLGIHFRLKCSRDFRLGNHARQSI